MTTEQENIDVEEAVEALADGNEEATPLSLEEQLEQAKAEMENYRDQWLRTRAEFANAKKRMEKERLDTYTHALTDVVNKLLPALDDYDRALETVPTDIAEHSWYEGIGLVHRKLAGILEGLNIEKITAVGEPFDPMLHEAIMQEESKEFESGVVTKELQPGYKRGEWVIRPSLVAVAI